MVKEPKKDYKLPSNPFLKDLGLNSNTINSVISENKTPPKSRKQIYQENYQKNKERKKAQQKINYAKKKEQAELTNQQQQSKYYGAEAFKILMPFKQYPELNKEKKQL